MIGCAYEQKAHGGAVDRCGQQDTVFAMLVGLIKPFEVRKFFDDLDGFVVLTSCSDA